MNLKQRIGLRVKQGRRLRNMTQAQLAEAISKTFETVSNIERGKTAPNFNTLHDISNRLDVPMRDFFDERGESDAGKSAYRLECEGKIKSLATEMTDRPLNMFVRICETILDS